MAMHYNFRLLFDPFLTDIVNFSSILNHFWTNFDNFMTLHATLDYLLTNFCQV